MLPYLVLSCPPLGSSWGHLGALLDPPGSHLGALLGHLWATLGPPGATLGPSWGRLGPPWGLLGALMGHLGALLGHGLPILGQLGHLWASLGAFWAPSWLISGPSWNHRGVGRGASWGHPLIVWANRRALLRVLHLPFHLSWSCLPTPGAHLVSKHQASEGPRRGREAITISN